MKTLTTVEMYIWDFLEENRQKVAQMTISELADLAHVSPSSVIRTLKKKNFSGFSEYKNTLKHEGTSKTLIHGLNDKARRLVNENIEELLRTVSLIDSESLSQVLKQIYKASSVVILSRGLSVRISDTLAKDLQYLDVKAVSLFLENMQEYLERLPESTFVIGVSLSGETQLVVETVMKAKKMGKKILAITSNYQSTLATNSDYVLLAYQKSADTLIGNIDYNNMIPVELLTSLLVKLYQLYKEEGAIT